MSLNAPKLSYVVLSYNYEHYIGKALESILRQTVQDFEIVVVDDGSTDGSVEHIRSLNDQRIRLYVNEKNMGGAWSYNRAVELSNGEFLVNLDADDWVAREKAERQLTAFNVDPTLDIVGTYISAVDSNGGPHPDRELIERYCNQKINLNSPGSWIVQNTLCRSSTMMRRAAHMRIGLDDPTMVYACDFELWTRALRDGCKFEVIPSALTYYRWHGGNITHKNPRVQLFEIVYLLGRNILPAISKGSHYVHVGRMFDWLINNNEQFARLRAAERYRLLAFLLSPKCHSDFSSFLSEMQSKDQDPIAEQLGRLCLSMYNYAPSKLLELSYFRDAQAYERAKREWFLPRMEHLEREASRLQTVVEEAECAKREWFLPRMEHLEQEAARCRQSSRRPSVPKQSGSCRV